jgi:hypothetical protein
LVDVVGEKTPMTASDSCGAILFNIWENQQRKKITIQLKQV